MSFQYFSESEINQANGLAEQQLQELGQQGFLESTLQHHDADLTTLAPGGSSHYSPGEAFTYKAELVNAYQEKGRLDFLDTWSAQQKAELYGYQSDAALEAGADNFNGSEAYNHIKESVLIDSYNERGYLDYMSTTEADIVANQRAPFEQINFDSASFHDLTPGGELIRDAELSSIYTENGTWTHSDVYNSEIHGYLHGSEVDYLL